MPPSRLLRRVAPAGPTSRSASCCRRWRHAGAWDDTAIIFTSDHGDMCGSHGLRSKGPFVYDEIMRVPMHVRVPGVTAPGRRRMRCRATSTSPTRSAGLAGVEPDPAMQGVDLFARTAPRPRPVRARHRAHAARRSRPATPSEACSTAATSTPATTASAAASPATIPSTEHPTHEAVRRRRRLRRPGPRAVRPAGGSPRAREPRQRPRPPQRRPRPLRAPQVPRGHRVLNECWCDCGAIAPQSTRSSQLSTGTSA